LTEQGVQEAGRVVAGKFTGEVWLLKHMQASLGGDKSEAAWLKKFRGSYLWAEQVDEISPMPANAPPDQTVKRRRLGHPATRSEGKALMFPMYILSGKTPVRAATWDEWEGWMKSHQAGQIAETQLDDVVIHTFFTGFGPKQPSESAPGFFQTRVRGDEDWTERRWTYSTWDDAVAGHERVVSTVYDILVWA
jgi:hypothetical protein